MQRYTMKIIASSLLTFTLFSGCSGESVADANNAKAKFGKALFLDTNLSNNGTMACATCHDLNHAMVDSRATSITNGASTGADGASIGDRNAPTAAYAAFSPEFGVDEDGLYVGGEFLDGRASDLKAQAKGPFLNPGEMNNTIEGVVSAVKADATLNAQMKTIYGTKIFDNNISAYNAIAESIATFEKTVEFAPFDSKFDRWNEGSYSFTPQEAEGKKLFEGKATCVACHPISGYHSPITDYSYDNLGVPANTALRSLNGVTAVDNGLGGRNDINNGALYGAFKVPTLRNVAVTGPYMHNGIFQNLKTVVHFYNTRDIGGINPETNATWAVPEVPETVNHMELGDLGLSDAQEDAIVAFLKTFTDKKFESLIP